MRTLKFVPARATGCRRHLFASTGLPFIAAKKPLGGRKGEPRFAGVESSFLLCLRAVAHSLPRRARSFASTSSCCYGYDHHSSNKRRHVTRPAMAAGGRGGRRDGDQRGGNSPTTTTLPGTLFPRRHLERAKGRLSSSSSNTALLLLRLPPPCLGVLIVLLQSLPSSSPPAPLLLQRRLCTQHFQLGWMERSCELRLFRNGGCQ